MNVCLSPTHLMASETVGLKWGGKSALHLGHQRLSGSVQLWRHGRQRTCRQGRAAGSLSSSKQTGQEMPNLYITR